MHVKPNPIKAAATRQAAQDFARKNLKLDFADKAHWRELAGARGIHLPAWYVTATGGRLGRFAERLGLTIHDVYAGSGCRSFRSLAELNSTWPLYAYVGLLLELAVELKK